MSAPVELLGPSDAAERLGVSTKALRIYEERSLIAPTRTAAGWRVYGPDDISRAAKIITLRSLGFSLAEIAHVLDEDARGLARALAARQASLEHRMGEMSATVERVRRLRSDIANGRAPSIGEPMRPLATKKKLAVAFNLPWPWGGERFELSDIRSLTYIVGPLFSGKTRLAQCLAATIHNAAFVGLERLEKGGAAARAQLGANPVLRSRVDQALSSLVNDGASRSDTLIALLVGLAVDGPDALVVDMVEHGLDKDSQRAVVAHLRRRGANARPLFLMTRSCEILDLASVEADEAIIFCPANHSPPSLVDPRPGAPGYEAVATCLAPPDVRARTEGVIAWRPTAN